MSSIAQAFISPAPNVKDIDGDIQVKILTEPGEYATDIILSCVTVDENGEEKVLGRLNGYIIKREDMGFEEMDELSSDAENLVGTLFDSEGSFTAESTHDTGVFGHELEDGDILLIESTVVNDEFMRKGVGKSMVELALNTAKDLNSVRWAFAWPVGRGEEEPDSDRSQGGWYRTRPEDFFRAIGFRKVGRTHWFCYAMDPNHPSRNYEAKTDSFEDFYQRLKGR